MENKYTSLGGSMKLLQVHTKLLHHMSVTESHFDGRFYSPPE